MPKCMITGCDLEIAGQFIHGDLWEDGNVWIFNAVGDFREVPSGWTEKVVSVFDEDHKNYFERRNVFVFQKLHSTLNDAAQAYITRPINEL